MMIEPYKVSQATIDARRAVHDAPKKSTHQAKRVATVGGVGTNFGRIARLLRYPECQGCAALSHKMNAWGPEGCRENEAVILLELEARAKKRKLTFSRLGARAALALAIKLTPNQTIELEDADLIAWKEQIEAR